MDAGESSHRWRGRAACKSALWAGPASLAGARRSGQVQGTVRREPISLRLGVGGDGLGYLVDLGLPAQTGGTVSYFLRDPHIKREAVFAGPVMRPGTLAARRRQHVAELRTDEGWAPTPVRLPPYRSMLTEYADPTAAPELWAVRSALRRWRFYDGFRADALAPARSPQVGTRTPTLADDGADLAAALATILEEDAAPLREAVSDAFPGSRLDVVEHDGLFDVALHQPGMLRPLRAAELSDGTLRYLLWLAALLTLDPPELMVLNEPETSLHPSLLPPLARLIVAATRRSQVVVVTHSGALLAALQAQLPGLRDPPGESLGDALEGPAHRIVELDKDLGETVVVGQGLLSTPAWEWGRR